MDYPEEALRAPPHAALDWQRILRLFTAKHSRDRVERQAAAVHQVCRSNSLGFLVSDLPNVQVLLRHCRARLDQQRSEFDAATRSLVEHVALPFWRRVSTDSVRYVTEIENTVLALSELLDTPHVSIHADVADALKSFVAHPVMQLARPDDGCSAADMAKYTTYFTLTQAQNVVLSLVQCLRQSQQLPVSLAVVRALHDFSQGSTTNCGHMLDAEAPEMMLQLMQQFSQMHEAFPFKDIATMLAALWNICESQEDAPTRIGRLPQCFPVLHALLHRVVRDGGSSVERELRNDILLLLMLLSMSDELHPQFLPNSLLDQILCLRPAHIVAPEDLEMTVLQWRIILNTSRHSECLNVIIRRRFVKDLLVYLVLDAGGRGDGYTGALMHTTSMRNAASLASLTQVYPGAPGKPSAASAAAAANGAATGVSTTVGGPGGMPQPMARRWSPSQLRELRLHVLSMLFHVAPRCAADFQTHGGNRILLKFLLHAPDAELQYQALRTLLSVADLFPEELGREGAVDALMPLVGEASNSRKVRREALSILAELCGPAQEANKDEFARLGGIAVCISMLSRYSPHDPERAEDMLVCAIDCVWNVCSGSVAHTLRVVSAGGVHVLLDVLEQAPDLMKFQLLGLLADIVRVDEGKQYFYDWISDASERSAPSVLIQMWQSEEQRLGVTRPGATDAAQSGSAAATVETLVAANDQHPLRPPADHPPSVKLFDDRLNNKSLAGTVVADAINRKDLRHAIAAVLAQVDSNQFQGLMTSERVKLLLIERFAEFKAGEVWSDMTYQLNDEEIRPVTPDRESLHAATARSRILAKSIREQQVAMINEQFDHDRHNETQFLKSLTSSAARADQRAANTTIQDLTASIRNEWAIKQHKRNMIKSSLRNQGQPHHYDTNSVGLSGHGIPQRPARAGSRTSSDMLMRNISRATLGGASTTRLGGHQTTSQSSLADFLPVHLQ